MIRYLEKESDFDELINKDLILVDFYADWCGPCKMLGNVLEQVDAIDVLKINVDEFSGLAQKFGVMSIPTICFFDNGELKKKEIGFRSLTEIQEILKDIKKEID